ncbi:SPOR domain-containing protein [Neptunicoccus sediminis]|uniref:SPOR domain-containing protein n=1 Tax=Neptunicoccus sediminis TaxID=1892596 RepID=UPI001FE1F607|nr:SPOR domain-containing protein [Neptunicoccus sediminis]
MIWTGNMSNGKFSSSKGKLVFALLAGVALAGCEDGGFEGMNLGFGKKDAETATAETSGKVTPGSGKPIKLVERDVEAPEVFEKNENALWDGRPSLGGVWIAHPDSKQPERVIIRNESNGKFVVGALFRRERDNPGPSLQLSSEAAAALGVQAGSPTKLRVTALRKETINENAEIEAEVQTNVTESVSAVALDAPAEDDLAAKARASVQKAEAKPKPVAKPATPPKAAKGAKYAQIGFFSIESNAKANVARLKKNGVPAKIVKSTTNGKDFWRVLAGPASSASEQRQLLNMVKGQGFADAYMVSG